MVSLTSLSNRNEFLPGFNSEIGSYLRGYFSGHHLNEDYLISSKIPSNENNLDNFIDLVSNSYSGKKINSNFHIDISPNPSELIFNVRILGNDISFNNTYKLLITDIKGNLLESYIFSDNEFSLDLGKLPSGSYIMNVTDKESSKDSKIIFLLR